MENKLCVLGLGYIGLPTSAVFANNGWRVTGIDINSSAIKKLNNGQVHIKETGLDELVKKVVENGTFVASMTPVEANVFILAVSTPHNNDGSADLTNVKNAVNSIIPFLQKGNTIILESTVPPRTTRDVVAPILENAGFIAGKDVYLAYCPERVLPGQILTELVENNRIIGGINSQSAKKAAEVYRTLVKGKVIETSAESAEMSKLMENTYRDVNIALANELAKISETLKIDPLEVIKLANEHPRVNVHQPGPGVGGHCIAVDPYFIIEKDQENTKLIQEARNINESMPMFVVNQIKKLVQKPAKVALFGLAFKGNVDDIRNSPSLEIRRLLLEENFNVSTYDPYIKQEQVSFYLSDYNEAIKEADLIVILTDHDEFKYMNWKEIQLAMKNFNVLDTKNCIENPDKQMCYFTFGNLYELNKPIVKI